jgi:hypothetical protein
MKNTFKAGDILSPIKDCVDNLYLDRLVKCRLVSYINHYGKCDLELVTLEGTLYSKHAEYKVGTVFYSQSCAFELYVETEKDYEIF